MRFVTEFYEGDDQCQECGGFGYFGRYDSSSAEPSRGSDCKHCHGTGREPQLDLVKFTRDFFGLEEVTK